MKTVYYLCTTRQTVTMKFIYRVSGGSSGGSDSKKRCIEKDGDSDGNGSKKMCIEEETRNSYLDVLPQEMYDRICKYTCLSDYCNLLAASERTSNEYKIIFDFANEYGDLHGYKKFSGIQLRRKTQYTDCVCDELGCDGYRNDMWTSSICGHSRLKIALDVVNETVQRNFHLYDLNIIQNEDYDIKNDTIDFYYFYEAFEPFTVCGLCNKHDKCPRNIFLVSLLKYLNGKPHNIPHSTPSTFNMYLINKTILF
ncbi:cyun139 [Cyclophragma undans nucleopolyhedrovirus]|uniref:Cyun139 n=1 Tax=Cyclophragma undans nucleopolyhedrovirus TaxID=1906244 RepID=A0A288QPY5_9ABAC|nr:cyun139 [Cyclophragma undans nucleopolyhedrovirus]AOT85597.1 cyun139 [Cyclophragma undans nucleopolyhedrovirus]